MPETTTATTTANAIYTIVDTIAVTPETVKFIEISTITNKETGQEIQKFRLEFLGSHAHLGEQVSYRPLGLQSPAGKEPFVVEPLKTLEGSSIVVQRRDIDGNLYFSVKGASKDYKQESLDMQARAKAFYS